MLGANPIPACKKTKYVRLPIRWIWAFVVSAALGEITYNLELEIASAYILRPHDLNRVDQIQIELPKAPVIQQYQNFAISNRVVLATPIYMLHLSFPRSPSLGGEANYVIPDKAYAFYVQRLNSDGLWERGEPVSYCDFSNEPQPLDLSGKTQMPRWEKILSTIQPKQVVPLASVSEIIQFENFLSLKNIAYQKQWRTESVNIGRLAYSAALLVDIGVFLAIAKPFSRSRKR